MNDFLHRLCDGEEPLAQRLLIVVAHPDDEVIGAGGQLPRWRRARLIHTTDGAPLDMRDALAYGFTRREDYAAARQKELTAALRLAGAEPAQVHNLGCVDQQASLHLVELVLALEDKLREFQPEIALTHPYEGGHPDHDATAFAVHVACKQLQKTSGHPPAIMELTSYHNRAGAMATGEFLPFAQAEPPVTLTLSPDQKEFKRRLLNCFATQRKVLQAFPVEWERFRAAPAYDFTAPAHSGRLYYEMFDWGMTGPRWCALARAALGEFGLSPAHGPSAILGEAGPEGSSGGALAPSVAREP